VDNSEKWRQSFNCLISSGVTNREVKVVVEPYGSWTTTKAAFLKKIETNNAVMLTDMDGHKHRKKEKLEIIGLEDFSRYIFFMIQKMEAWILSQPDKIEMCFADQKQNEQIDISEDEHIRDQRPENIAFPDDVLNTILSRYFKFEKNGKTKKLKYRGGKLKLAPDLIAHLDIHRLANDFEDVKRLLNHIQALT
jgi:hypothetical protein